MVTTSSPQINIVKKLEDIINDFGKNVFNSNKKVSFEIEKAELDKFVNGEVYSAFRYEDGKIYIKSGYLDLLINNYRRFPELIGDFLRGAVHEYVHALLDADPKKEETKKYIIAHEGLATLIGEIYKKISSDIKVNLNEDLEKILEDINRKVLEKIKDKKYLEKIDLDLRSKFSENLYEEIRKISEKNDKCIDFPNNKINLFDLEKEIKYHVLYKIPSLILQNKLGLQKIIEDLSRKVPIDKYQEIILEEFEKIPGKEIVANTLDCLDNKMKSYLNSILDEITNLESKIENLKSIKSIKE